MKNNEGEKSNCYHTHKQKNQISMIVLMKSNQKFEQVAIEGVATKLNQFKNNDKENKQKTHTPMKNKILLSYQRGVGESWRVYHDRRFIYRIDEHDNVDRHTYKHPRFTGVIMVVSIPCYTL